MLAQTSQPQNNGTFGLAAREYKYGFVSQVDTEDFPQGLSEEIIRRISAIKKEPEFILDFRLAAYRHWTTLDEPRWAHLDLPALDFQGIRYYSAPKRKGDGPTSLAEVDEEVIKTFEKLGISLDEQKRLSGIAVDAVFDSVSIATTHTKMLRSYGIIFCSISEAIRDYPELVQKYLGSVVSGRDNFYAALNSAVFSDGTFVYVPKNVRCPIELSTYFRINAQGTGQFERTLIIADEGSSVSYLEGCTAPKRDENQLHAAVVELIALDGAEIKYSTVQNWYAGDEAGQGGILNYVTKRGVAHRDAFISWTQVEVGSAITWKYPSVVLMGDGARGDFYSVALTNNKMQADTGTKMIHIGRNTKSRIISKGISADESVNNYRGLVKVLPSAEGARNFSQCDSMLVGGESSANTFPYIEVKNSSATVEHEATTARINADQIFYLTSRGIDAEEAVALILDGFCKDVFKELPLEFAVEARKLLEIKLEGSVG
jgi:Fe-S cluster assembly protein SufB